MGFINPVLAAQDLLTQFTYDDNIDLLYQIIQNNNINLEYWPFDNEVSGMFWYAPPDQKPTIVVNENDPPVRQRFTIAHEIGHFILKHGAQFCCLSKSTFTKTIENHANTFAAELLMPRNKVIELSNEFFDIKDMAEYFQVSQEAMYVRLKSLHLIRLVGQNA